MGGVDVVIDRVVLVLVAIHGVRGGTLLGEMDNRVRPVLRKPTFSLIVLSDINDVTMDAASCLYMPDADAFVNGFHRRQRLHTEPGVDGTAREIIEDVDLMTRNRQVKRCRPANETVATQDCNLHDGFSAGSRRVS